ncbi:MAG TPA: DUF2156 domain-containing protein [Tepidisphaeraceae bacterium]|jgi:phosphatidylglycerol lysyltransferase|nr:DUF2156 domain-containing protein [Tepidisphaeraceae bacterium]
MQLVPDIMRVRDLVLKYGHNPTTYQILNPGYHYFFSSTCDAVTAYFPRVATWVAAGAPVCAPEDLSTVVEEFERAAAAQRCQVCYVCAADRLRTLLASSTRHSIISLGAEPVWNPCNWPDLVSRQRSIRTQIARARNKGVTAIEKPALAARTDEALRSILAEWLASKNLPPMQFLNDSDPAAGLLEDRSLFVALHAGRPVAFLLASPIPRRNGHLVEQLARSPRSPNGTAELLIDHALRALAARGSTYVTLGLVPLSINAAARLDSNPLWIRPLFRWARAHGRRFYHFDGLESFRIKLHPDHWEPLYAIANRPNFPPRTLYALAAVMFGGNPFLIFSKAVASAIQQELRTLIHRPARIKS